MMIIAQRYIEKKHGDTRRDCFVQLCAKTSVILCVIKKPAKWLSQISTRYVTDVCRKYLPFLRQIIVTNSYFFCYKKKLNCNKYLLNLLQNKNNEHRR
jgi:hypothetical protein